MNHKRDANRKREYGGESDVAASGELEARVGLQLWSGGWQRI